MSNQLLKTTILLILFTKPLKIYGQIVLPHSIEIIYESGVNYSDDTIIGARINRDSIRLEMSKDKQTYFSNRSTHIHEILPFNGEGLQSNINPNPKITLFVDTEIRSSEIEHLIQLTNLKNYSKFISVDEFGLDSTYIPKDFSLEYYDIDTSSFDILFQDYEQKISQKNKSSFNQKNHSDSIQYDKLLRNLIEIAIEDWHYSYQVFIYVKLIFEGKSIELYQFYPGRFKTEWLVLNSETSNRLNILNPKINEIISKILPDKFSRNDILLNFSDKKAIYRLIGRE